ncbi:hypothetical protein Dda_3265 [Drechslerella dactyloides]|uniref:HNH nuclease domain-containing protein n=1 Tax=Drechslerella dactyloides TaxID=74499 RepID=A0AAD6J289_DREDA|nr:hypothetical protein Dda_3265 [Drechslerella dactyloides]
MLYSVELATRHMLTLETKPLSLPDAFRILCAHIADMRLPNPDNYGNGWRDLEITLPPALKTSLARPSSQELQFEVYGATVSVAHLIHALVTFSYDTSAVAWDLYRHLVEDQAVRKVLEGLVMLDGGDGDVRTAWARPVEGTWAQVAGALVEEADVRRVLCAWARDWFDGLLVPFMTKGGGKSAATLPHEASDRLREQLLARDGPITVVGSIVDRTYLTYPPTIDPSDYRAAGALSPAHIIPLAAATDARLRSSIQVFAGGAISASELTRKRINDARNSLLLTQDQSDGLGDFIFSIEAEEDKANAETRYFLRVYTMLTGPSLNGCRDREELWFADIEEAAQTPSPDARFCNLHTAVAKVVHASGAGAAIAAIISEERTASLQDAAATVEIWGHGGWEYLQRELRCLAEGAVEDI